MVAACVQCVYLRMKYEVIRVCVCMSVMYLHWVFLARPLSISLLSDKVEHGIYLAVFIKNCFSFAIIVPFFSLWVAVF